LKILSGELIPNFGDLEHEPTPEKVLQRFKGKELYSYFSDLYNKKLK
jgi:Predicted ATPase, RNase L inhibitor (RLI) homolog